MPPAADSPWVVSGDSLHSDNDPAGTVVDGSWHARRPVDYVERERPVTLRTTRPVPRVLRHGLLVVPDTIDALEPWSRLDLIVDVLSRPDELLGPADLRRPGPAPVWTMRPGDGQGTWDTWISRLPVPLSMRRLHAHALLPLDLRFVEEWYGEPGTPWLTDGVYVIR